MSSSRSDKSLKGTYEAFGGIHAFRRISKRFHQKIDEDPSLRDLFPADMSTLEERLALFLAELTGGPSDYSAARGKTSLHCRHAHLAISSAHSASWSKQMTESFALEGIEGKSAEQLLSRLAELAAALADPIVELYRISLEILRAKLTENPSLALANDRGRNLICAAAIAWDVPRLRLLLEFGADTEAGDNGGHNALYRVANGTGSEEVGREAVELLIAHGAKVNQATGVGAMTPLHMSARRGTTTIAEILLNAGAHIEARDKKGETPLRRAVNCGQTQMAAFLLSRGANPQSTDKQGRTPIDAARSAILREALLAER